MNTMRGKATLSSIPSPEFYRVRISEASARETSHFFDRIGDLNLSKFDPSSDQDNLLSMSTGYAKHSFMAFCARLTASDVFTATADLASIHLTTWTTATPVSMTL